MTALHFEWDEAKTKANITKHGVSFDEARTVFYDERARLISLTRTIPKMKNVSSSWAVARVSSF